MKKDKIIFDLIKDEEERQRLGIELIASENFVSDQVMKAMGSVLTNKYAEGYPGRRYYGGCQIVDQAEQIAIDRAKTLYNAEYANVQPHSGAQANMAVLLTCLKRETLSWGSTWHMVVTCHMDLLLIHRVFFITLLPIL